MKKLFYFILISVLTNACIIHVDDDDFDENCIHGNGNFTQETFVLSNFEQVSLSLPANVFITQEDKSEVRIEAEENILPHITTSVRNKTLNISTNRCFRNVSEITIYISSPNFSIIKNSGAANITALTTITAPNLDLTLSGVGNINMDLDSESLLVRINGSGNVDLSGEASNQHVNINGTANYKSFDLISKDCTITLSGVGNAEVYASKSLDAKINGTGNIRYKGDPESVISSISGTGNLIQVK